METGGQVDPPRAGEEVYQLVSEPGDAEEQVYQRVTGRQVYDSDSELGGQLYEQEAGGHHIGDNVRYPGSGNTGKHVYHSDSELDDQLYKPDPDQLEIGDQVYHSDAGEEMMDTPEPFERDYHSDPGVY